MRSRRIAAFAFTFAGMAADFDWNLPKGFPAPPVPAANPMSAAKVELGRYLFYEKRMSVNGKQSCGTCHRQELAFTDGRARAEGTTGQLHPRSSMSLVNVAYVPFLTWANPGLTLLEDQALVPMLGEEPVELGLKGHEREFLEVLQSEPAYQPLFAKAFPGETNPYTLRNVTKAIAAFERTIVSMRSRTIDTDGVVTLQRSRMRPSVESFCFSSKSVVPKCRLAKRIIEQHPIQSDQCCQGKVRQCEVL